jgi:glucokinase-like ROK family protein
MAFVFGITALDHSDMRERNLGVILNALHQHAPISRSGLAKRTGLNKATVTSLIRELSDAQLVRELDVIPPKCVGRPSIGLGLNPEAGCIISLEIAVDYISAIVTDFTADILWRHHETITAPLEEAPTLARAMQIISEACSQAAAAPGQVFGIACGVPGLVDLRTGTVLVAPNLGWANVPLKRMICNVVDVSVFVDNEANMAALGETYFGVAQGVEQVLYVSSGVGLGGGIVHYGNVLSGVAGFAGEIGHITMDPEGLPCKCGNRGCWETYATQQAVCRSVREAIEGGRESSLMEATGGDTERLTIALVLEASENGDGVARAALESAGRWLGIGIASLINILNPQRVVLGGTLSLAGDLLVPVINEVVKKRAWKWSQEVCDVVVAEYGADACLMGGIAAVHRHILQHVPRRTTPS